MIKLIVLLAIVASVFASDLPVWFEPHVLLLAFVGARVEATRAPLPVLFVAFLTGSATLDPMWLHLTLAIGAVALLFVLRRWFFAVRPLNQLWLTFVLGVIVLGGAVAPLILVYPHAGRWQLFLGAVETAGATALFAPVFFFVVDRVLLRPVRWRRGLLPSTGA